MYRGHLFLIYLVLFNFHNEVTYTRACMQHILTTSFNPWVTTVVYSFCRFILKPTVLDFISMILGLLLVFKRIY